MVFFSNCAALHQFSLGDIDSRHAKLKKFTIMKSELGIEVAKTAGKAGYILKRSGVINKRDAKRIKALSFILSISNMGPRTGKAIYDETYLDKLAWKIYEKCPSGKITGLTSIRESAKYVVISGEIGKIIGYCYGELQHKAETTKDKSKSNEQNDEGRETPDKTKKTSGEGRESGA
ncbi:MAG: hypothetical protein AAF518_00355 [Spirochaetota bacterium]